MGDVGRFGDGILGLGACSLILQVTALREFMAAFSGNELDLGITLAIWLLFAGIGSIAAMGRENPKALGMAVLLTGPLAQALFFCIPFIRSFLAFEPGEIVTIGATVLSTLVLLATCLFPDRNAISPGRPVSQGKGLPGVPAGGRRRVPGRHAVHVLSCRQVQHPRDPDRGEHGICAAGNAAAQKHIEHEITNHEFFGEWAREKLVYYPTVTREPFHNEGRLTDLVESGKLFADIGEAPLDPATDRAMICGSPAMLADTAAMLNARGFKVARHYTGELGDYVIERAFVEK